MFKTSFEQLDLGKYVSAGENRQSKRNDEKSDLPKWTPLAGHQTFRRGSQKLRLVKAHFPGVGHGHLRPGQIMSPACILIFVQLLSGTCSSVQPGSVSVSVRLFFP
jgi:hypothetical protein